MLTLQELKEPFEQILKLKNIDYKEYDCNDVADKLSTETDSDNKDIYMSILICNTWNAIQYIFYKPGNTVLTSEECWDIYMEALEYVINKKVWHNEDSSLYEDEDAFKKAVMQCTISRKMNYVNAQHKDKRIANYLPMSLDAIEDDFQEGFLANTDDGINDNIYDIEDLVREAFNKKDYLTALVIDAILYSNVFVAGSFNLKRLVKHVRNIDDKYCDTISEKYKLNPEEVKHSITYFNELNTEKINEKIEKVFTSLKNSNIIKSLKM